MQGNTTILISQHRQRWHWTWYLQAEQLPSIAKKKNRAVPSEQKCNMVTPEVRSAKSPLFRAIYVSIVRKSIAAYKFHAKS